MTKQAHKNGFTLIEVMIAMAILAVMAFLIFASTQRTLDSKEDTQKTDDLNHSVSMALSRMSADFQMAFLLSGADFLGTDGRINTVFIGKEDRADFPSFSRQRYFKDAKEADYGEVGYFLEDNKEEPGVKLLLRRDSKNLDNKPEEGGKTEVLIGGVQELHFEYYDANKKEWMKSWDSSQLEYSNRLPRAVRIQIKVLPPDGEEPMTFSTIAEVKLF